MGNLFRPFDPDRPMRLGCQCGKHSSDAEHAAAEQLTAADEKRATNPEELSHDFVEATLMKALFPQDSVRRAFIRAVGAGTARAALASVLPVASLQAMAQEKQPLEKKDLKIGFIAITCATPLIMAHPLGFYRRQGLEVQLNKTAGWALIRDKMLNKEHDASHFLSPMPIAISQGLGSVAQPMRVATIQNINGQAITLHLKHKDKRDPKDWKGFKLAIPFDYSMHNYLLRYYLAEHGVDPDTDVQLRAVPPPEMVANLRADNIDGFLAPDNICQRAIYDGVGFLHLLSKEIWDGHPCCAFAASREFITTSPNTFAALSRAILDATAYSSKAENRKEIADAIAPANYLNAPSIVLEQVLTGTYADGLGNIKKDPKRVDFDPFPWHSFAVWMLTQMKRWGQVKGDVDYKTVAEQVFLATDMQKQMKEAGLTPPAATSKTFRVMGKIFDPTKPEQYLAGFKIKKAA